MKMRSAVLLMGSLWASSFAMAAVSLPDYTLLTSDNLVGQYYFSDSGVYVSQGSDWLGYTPYRYDTTATVLGTYQNSDGQWFQTTQYVTTTSYDYSYQNYTQTRRDLSLYTYTPVTDAYIDLSVSTSTPMSYEVYAYGVNGSTTTPRGFTQVVNPSLGLVVDGAQVTSLFYAGNDGEYSSWQGRKTGSVESSFQAVAEAASGSYVQRLDVYLTDEKHLGEVTTYTSRWESSRWTQDVAISAPVPEPETFAMLLAGLGVLGAVARRRKQNQG